MSWIDRRNQSLFTTGWQLFVAGLFATIGASTVFIMTEGVGKALAAAVEIVGLLLLLAAIFVWLAKLYTKLTSRDKKIGVEKSLRIYMVASSLAIVLLLSGLIFMAVELMQVKNTVNDTNNGVGSLQQSFNNFCLSKTQDANQC
jgi:hypothetical protein